MANTLKTTKPEALPALDGPVDVNARARTDIGKAGRIGLWALGIGFGGFLLWAAFAPGDGATLAGRQGLPAPPRRL